ncbi:hypothetical protein [Clostridium sp.]|uniref:hypothetical protein n=1 Tax=Clostridium sp. TaxID=1506 RepID=UPI002FCAA3C7
MRKTGFNILFWGFLFDMIDFRINNFDILPDIIGHILFLIGLLSLASYSVYFNKAKNYSVAMVALSIFGLFQGTNVGIGTNTRITIGVTLLLVIAALIVYLLLLYNIFMGIKDLATTQQIGEIYDEADKRWVQFIWLQILIIPAFIIMFIPLINLIYVVALLIANIVLAINIMKLMKRCEQLL